MALEGNENIMGYMAKEISSKGKWQSLKQKEEVNKK